MKRKTVMERAEAPAAVVEAAIERFVLAGDELSRLLHPQGGSVNFVIKLRSSAAKREGRK